MGLIMKIPREDSPLIQDSPSQFCKKTSAVIDIAGGILVVTGIASAAFSKAQYAVPIIAAAAGGTCAFMATLVPLGNERVKDAESDAVAFTLAWRAFIGGLMAGGVAFVRTWDPLVKFVSTSPTAKLAGPLGLGMIACGGSLWIASSCLPRNNNDFWDPKNHQD